VLDMGCRIHHEGIEKKLTHDGFDPIAFSS
jgi:hypothetical protein